MGIIIQGGSRVFGIDVLYFPECITGFVKIVFYEITVTAFKMVFRLLIPAEFHGFSFLIILLGASVTLRLIEIIREGKIDAVGIRTFHIIRDIPGDQKFGILIKELKRTHGFIILAPGCNFRIGRLIFKDKVMEYLLSSAVFPVLV